MCKKFYRFIICYGFVIGILLAAMGIMWGWDLPILVLNIITGVGLFFLAVYLIEIYLPLKRLRRALVLAERKVDKQYKFWCWWDARKLHLKLARRTAKVLEFVDGFKAKLLEEPEINLCDACAEYNNCDSEEKDNNVTTCVTYRNKNITQGVIPCNVQRERCDNSCGYYGTCPDCGLSTCACPDRQGLVCCPKNEPRSLTDAVLKNLKTMADKHGAQWKTMRCGGD